MIKSRQQCLVSLYLTLLEILKCTGSGEFRMKIVIFAIVLQALIVDSAAAGVMDSKCRHFLA